MAGSIGTYQKCPRCGAAFPTSKGGFPIICENGCQTQPTKYFIKIYWRGNDYTLYHDRDGKTIHYWDHAVATIGDIRARMVSHKSGKGYFSPDAYKRQSATSFKSFWERFEKKYKGSTGDKVKAIGKHHLVYFHDMQMRDIVSWQVAEWWTKIEEKKLSASYMIDIHGWTKTFFLNALSLDVIEKMPKFPKPPSKPEPNVEEWWTQEEQVAVYEALPDHDKPIYDFMFLTGCRPNEATGLQRTDTDWKHGATYIRHTRKRDGSVGIVKNKKVRRIPHVPEIKSCLLKSVRLDSEFQFVNKWGRPYTDDYLRDALYRVCDSLEIKRIPLKNATRHSFGMGLLRKGYDIWQVSKAMNHSSIRMTEHYARMLESEVDRMYGRGSEVVEVEKKKKKSS